MKYLYLRRQQERGLMQKARRLMDENSVSFQMFLILLSFITLGSEGQISVFKQCQSNTQMSGGFSLIELHKTGHEMSHFN